MLWTAQQRRAADNPARLEVWYEANVTWASQQNILLQPDGLLSVLGKLCRWVHRSVSSC